MLNPYQFVNLILEPSLRACNLYSIDAMYLMTCTALVESKLTHLKQLPEGLAVGLLPIEPEDYKLIYKYLTAEQMLRSTILIYCERSYLPANFSNVMSDLALNVLLARVKYLMSKEVIPSYKDSHAQAQYYHKYYNYNKDCSKIDEFIKQAESIIGQIKHDESAA